MIRRHPDMAAWSVVVAIWAVALVMLAAAVRREPDYATARWLEDDDGILPADPWTVR